MPEMPFFTLLARSGWIHAPLPLPLSHTLERELEEKAPLARRVLWDGRADAASGGRVCWEHRGLGTLTPCAGRTSGEGCTERTSATGCTERVSTAGGTEPVSSAGCGGASDRMGLDEQRGGCDVHAAVLRLTAPCRAASWPEGASPDGDYTNFGVAQAVFPVAGEDWRDCNRLVFHVRPDCPGLHAPCLQVGLVNEGAVSVPDPFGRDGFHVCNLRNREWNICIWEFPDLPRDRVMSLTFSAYVNGRDATSRLPAGGEDLVYDFARLTLEQVAVPENALGWAVADGTAAVSSGYFSEGVKLAILGTPAETFRLVAVPQLPDAIGICGTHGRGDASGRAPEPAGGRIVHEGAVRRHADDRGVIHFADFSDFRIPGRYRIEGDGFAGGSFTIAQNPFRDAIWKVINFLYCERCGHPVSNRHGACHHDLVAAHGGLSMTYAGGWHDAGDMSQQTAQTAEITQTLFSLAERFPEDDPLRIRLLEEAEWGLDFVLRTRFGDGARASSAGVTRWTDGLVGNMDDVPVRVHSHAFLNWLCAGVEAHASIVLRGRDPELARHCLQVAVADWRFAEARFQSHGIELPSFFEHTYPTAPSGYAALAAWSSALLHEACAGMPVSDLGDRASMSEACAGMPGAAPDAGGPMMGAGDGAVFAEAAWRYARNLMACQEDRGLDPLHRGFFCRDASRRVVAHHNHQSREHLPAQALARMLRNWPEHPDADRWRKSLELLGAHYKALAACTAPYGMLPAGIHRMDEPQDEATFRLLHLFADPVVERSAYARQLAAGVPVGTGGSGVEEVVRRFPVWFSFRGNTAVHLSAGAAAAIAGNATQDAALADIARGQLYWLHGMNPFRQSLMYGEGARHAQQYAVLPGEMVGEMPVGIQTAGDGDEPFWPQANNATYKEVWVSTAAHWLRVMTELPV